MKKHLLLTLVVFILAETLFAGIYWTQNIEGAFATARQRDTVIMVDVFTDNCPYCVKMDKEVFSTTTVSRLSKYFVNLKVNRSRGGKYYEFCQERGIYLYPTVLFLDADGNELARLVGYKRDYEVIEVMRKFKGAATAPLPPREKPTANEGTVTGAPTTVGSPGSTTTESETQHNNTTEGATTDSSEKSDLSVVNLGGNTSTQPARAYVSWMGSIEQAQAQARRLKTGVMIVVLDREAESLQFSSKALNAATLASASKSLANVRVYSYISNKNIEFVSQYGISTYPTTLFIDADSNEIARFTGAASADEIIKEMQKTYLSQRVRFLREEHLAGNLTSSRQLYSLYFGYRYYEHAAYVLNELRDMGKMPIQEIAQKYYTIVTTCFGQRDFKRVFYYASVIMEQYSETTYYGNAVYYYGNALYTKGDMDMCVTFAEQHLENTKLNASWQAQMKSLMRRAAAQGGVSGNAPAVEEVSAETTEGTLTPHRLGN